MVVSRSAAGLSQRIIAIRYVGDRVPGLDRIPGMVTSYLSSIVTNYLDQIE
jgi:hypothetical protein